MWIFDAIKHHQEPGVLDNVAEFCILRRRSVCDHPLMIFSATRSIEAGALFESHGDTAFATKVDDFLEAGAPGALRDQHAIDRAACLQRLSNWMNTHKNAHDSLIVP